MNTNKRRFAAIIATGALVAGGLMLGASAANADQISPTGTITLYGADSNGATDQSKKITSGSSTSNPMFYGISVDKACPAGARAGASVQVIQNGVRVGNLGILTTPDIDGLFGTNGLSPSDTSINLDESFTAPAQNPYVDNNKSLEAVSPALVTGDFEVHYYCYADTQNIDFAADKYFSLTLHLDLATHTWSTPVQVVQQPTTLSVSATGNPDNTVLLSIDLKVNGVVTGVPGTYSLFINGEGPLAGPGDPSGHNEILTDPLDNGLYVFKVTFTPTDSAAFSGSSGEATVQFGVDGSPASSTITVTIPNNVGKLTLSGVPTSVPLGTASLVDGVLQAEGNLTGVTVTDTRQLDFPAWSLTGQVGDFTDTTNTHTLLGKYLGWAPHVTSGASTSTAGAAVAPAPTSPAGISTVSPFGAGHPTDGETETVFDAPLQLKAPANTPAGDYSATLTITLA